MNAFVRAMGSVLRLVGISSPEDAGAKIKAPPGVPSWRDAAPSAKGEEGETAKAAGDRSGEGGG